MLQLIEIINQTDSEQIVKKYSKEFEFIMFDGMKKVKKYDSLFSTKAENISTIEASEQFFSILNQLILFLSKTKSGNDDDAWVIWKTFTLFFSNMQQGIDFNNDTHLKSLMNKYISLWKEEKLYEYLNFFSYFIQGKSYILPDAKTYETKFRPILNIRKTAENEEKSAEDITTIMSKMYLEKIAFIPEIKFVDSSDFEKMRNAETQSETSATNCNYLKKRMELFDSDLDEIKSAKKYNTASYLLEECSVETKLPFIIREKEIIIPSSEQYAIDIALSIFIAKYGNLSFEKASSLMAGAMISSVHKYGSGSFNSHFGSYLIYAYYTGRMKSFKDAMFLYPIFKEKNFFSKDEMKSITEFTVQFFIPK